MKRILLLISCLLSLPVWCQPCPASSSSCVGDSLCGKPFFLHFRFDRSLVDYGYMQNARTLLEFESLFSDSLFVSLIDTVRVTAFASPDGDSRYNFRLSHRRAVAVKGYLVWKFPLLDQYRILVRSQGEDWAGLRELVATDSALPNRDEVLSILDKEPDTELRKVLLRRLNQGRAYRYINKYLLPKLRNAAVCTVRMKQHVENAPFAAAVRLPADVRATDSSGVAEDPAADSLSNIAEQPIDNVAAASSATSVTAASPSSGRPLLSLKTNLLTWAGILPDGKSGSFRPNLAAEVFFARRWSLQASAEYSHWQGGKGNKFWGISGYSLEPRFWFKGNNSYRRLYLGAYGQLGDYDYRPNPEGDNTSEATTSGNPVTYGLSRTGTYWSTGLSLGVYVPLTRHFGLEAGIRGGYRKTSGTGYDHEPPHAYYHHEASGARWGITGLNLSFSYRWLSK